MNRRYSDQMLEILTDTTKTKVSHLTALFVLLLIVLLGPESESCSTFERTGNPRTSRSLALFSLLLLSFSYHFFVETFPTITADMAEGAFSHVNRYCLREVVLNRKTR